MRSKFMNNQLTIKLLFMCKVTHCAECGSANTRPQQLHLGDREIGTLLIAHTRNADSYILLVYFKVYNCMYVPF